MQPICLTMRKFQRHGNKKSPIWGNFYLVLNALDRNILNFDRIICLCRTAISTFESPVFIRIGIWLTIVCKFVNTRFSGGRNGTLSITENNHLILKVFATAWRYREMYERDGGVDNIIHNLHTSPRQFYRYLDIAYMNPDKVNEILSGKIYINVNDLFQIARENTL